MPNIQSQISGVTWYCHKVHNQRKKCFGTHRWPHIVKDSITNIQGHLPSHIWAGLGNSTCPSLAALRWKHCPRDFPEVLKIQDTLRQKNPLKATPYRTKHPSLMIYTFFPLASLLSNYWSYKTLSHTKSILHAMCSEWLLSLVMTSLCWHISTRFLCDQSTETGL